MSLVTCGQIAMEIVFIRAEVKPSTPGAELDFKLSMHFPSYGPVIGMKKKDLGLAASKGAARIPCVLVLSVVKT